MLFQLGNDILMPLALEKWPRLAETLRKDWPANADVCIKIKYL